MNINEQDEPVLILLIARSISSIASYIGFIILIISVYLKWPMLQLILTNAIYWCAYLVAHVIFFVWFLKRYYYD